MASCIHCGARNVDHTHNYDTCPAVLAKKQNDLLKEGLKLQKKAQKSEPSQSNKLLAGLLMAPFKLMGWGISNHREIDEFNKSWESYALKHWKGILRSLVGIIIFAAIVGSFQK